MSYDIKLVDPVTEEVLLLPERHHLRGGTYCLGTVSQFPEGRYVFTGTREAWLNITYNYSEFYYKTLDSDKGIRVLYGMTGREAMPILSRAIAELGIVRHSDYWKSTPGNAGAALADLLTLATALPDGVFRGD